MTMSSRARTREGRRVRYFPTAAELAAGGAGDYVGQIAHVNADGSATIRVIAPNGAASAVTGARFGSRPGQYDFFGGVTA